MTGNRQQTCLLDFRVDDIVMETDLRQVDGIIVDHRRFRLSGGRGRLWRCLREGHAGHRHEQLRKTGAFAGYAAAVTVASTTLVLSSRSRLSCSTNSDSNDSTTAERLSVIDLAWLTKSSFKVRCTGRFRAALKPVFMFRLRYAHYMRILILWSNPPYSAAGLTTP